MKRLVLVLLALALLLAVLAFFLRDRLMAYFFSPTSSNIPTGVQVSQLASPAADNQQADVTVVAENLDIPWEIVFLPNGDLLVTERPGRLIKVSQETQLIQEIEGVEHVGEGGLLGMALHPDFDSNQWLYLYLTARTDQGLENRIERYRFDGEALSEKQVIFDGIPGAQYHDGGKIEFGPDGYLYVTTGDAGSQDLAQNTTTLQGKILRLTDIGQPAPDNPFQNEIYSYGHRNPQGLAWDEQGQLWSTEHGPSGLQSGNDELNLIQAGGNYGWPVIKGQQTQEGMITPVIESGTSETWAPAAAVYYQGSIFFTGLRGESLYQVKTSDNQATDLTAHLRGEYGRLRALKVGPDGYLYISTSNQDGRGDVLPGDDKIIKINPQVFVDAE